MSYIQQQKGNLVIEVVLGLIVLVSVGAAVYTAHRETTSSHVAKPNVVKKAAVKSTPGIPNSAEVYKDWKTYTSADEGLTFRYPSDWKLSAQPSDGRGEVVDVTSPSGFKLEYFSDVAGLGGGCEPNGCPDITTYAVEKVPGTNAPSDLYYVEASFKSNEEGDPNKGKYQPAMGLIGKTDTSDVPRVGILLQTYPYSFIAQKHSVKTNGLVSGYMMFSLKPGTNFVSNQDAVKNFFNSPDAKIAKLIFESVKY